MLFLGQLQVKKALILDPRLLLLRDMFVITPVYIAMFLATQGSEVDVALQQVCTNCHSTGFVAGRWADNSTSLCKYLTLDLILPALSLLRASSVFKLFHSYIFLTHYIFFFPPCLFVCFSLMFLEFLNLISLPGKWRWFLNRNVRNAVHKFCHCFRETTSISAALESSVFFF